MKIIITILILYLVYKLIFGFIVPVAKTTNQFKSQMSEMQRMQEEQMRTKKEQQTKSASPPAAATSKKPSPGTIDSEYIDFEDVK